MLTNYFKIAWRNLLKNKSFSLINIFGLASGITVALLIGLWIFHELSYDDFHKNKSHIYRVLVNGVSGNSGEKYTMFSVALPLAEKLQKDIPGVKHVVESNWEGKHGLKAGEKKITRHGTDVGTDFFKVFQFRFLNGNATSALKDPNSIVLTKATAEALFGDIDVIGQTVRWNNVSDLKVTAVVADMPANSYFSSFEYFMSFAHYENRASWVKESRTQWDNFSFQLFAELDENVSQAQVESQIRNLLKERDSTTQSEVALFPMGKWRLYNEFRNWKSDGGLMDYIKMFGVVGILVLLIACINFMNLSTARSEKRAREVGVRKSVGSDRKSLILQFLGESILLSALAFLLAMVILLLVLPSFNLLIDGRVTIPYQYPIFWLICACIILITGLVAGSYPALYLSSFSAIQVLKGSFKVGKKGALPRKILVVAQFTASVALIVSTIVIYRQIGKIQGRPTGYNPKHVILVDMKDDLAANYNIVRNELLATGLIERVSKSSSPIHSIWSNWNVDDFPGRQPEEKISVAVVAVSEGYFKTLQTQIKQGRDFYDNGSLADSTNIILNEAAVKRMRLENPIGQVITLGESKLQVVGVAENIIMSSPFEPVGPAAFLFYPNWASTLMFRIKSDVSINQAITKVTPIFNKHNPAFPFEYEFADEEFGKKVQFEKTVGRLAGIFALLTVLISCLGLLGLSAYVAEQRTKEIGIRKVLGATVLNLWQMLSKDFVVLVLISSVIAIPIAYYYMNEWLQKYAIRTQMEWWIFGFAVLGAVLTTLVTVSFQAIKAAIANPVKSLRNE